MLTIFYQLHRFIGTVTYARYRAEITHRAYEMLLFGRYPAARLFDLYKHRTTVTPAESEKVGKSFRETCREVPPVFGVSRADVGAEDNT